MFKASLALSTAVVISFAASSTSHSAVLDDFISDNDIMPSMTLFQSSVVMADTNVNVAASGIRLGPGLTGVTANNIYSASGWTQDATLMDTDSDYFEFVVAANPGFQINFTTFEYHADVQGQGPTMFSFRSSADGFTNDLGMPDEMGTTINLNFSQIGTTTFRFYGFDAGVDNPANRFEILDYVFNGTVSAIPEPSTALFLCLTACGGAFIRTRCRERLHV